MGVWMAGMECARTCTVGFGGDAAPQCSWGAPPFAGRFSAKAIYPKEKPTGSGLSVLLFLKLSGNEV